MDLTKAVVLFVVAIPCSAYSADFGYFIKGGHGGRIQVDRPSVERLTWESYVEYTDLVPVITYAQTTETVPSETVSAGAISFGGGMTINRDYSLEIGSGISVGSSWGHDEYDDSLSFKYLCFNKLFNLANVINMNAGIGVSKWNTDELTDDKRINDYKTHREISGESPLATLGVDYIIAGNTARSHMLGFHFYKGFDSDYSHQMIQLEYAYYSW